MTARTYEFTIKKINGQKRVADYKERGVFIADTPIGDEPKEIVDECKQLKRNLGLGNIRFSITVGEE